MYMGGVGALQFAVWWRGRGREYPEERESREVES